MKAFKLDPALKNLWRQKKESSLQRVIEERRRWSFLRVLRKERRADQEASWVWWISQKGTSLVERHPKEEECQEWRSQVLTCWLKVSGVDCQQSRIFCFESRRLRARSLAVFMRKDLDWIGLDGGAPKCLRSFALTRKKCTFGSPWLPD